MELVNRKADRIILVKDVFPDFRPSDYVVGYYGDTYEYKSPENRTWKDLFSQPDASETGTSEEKDLWAFTRSLASDKTGMDMDKPFYDEVLRLWEDAKTESNTFHLLPCPPKRRIIDMFRKLCAK